MGGRTMQSAATGLKTRNSANAWFSAVLACAARRLRLDDAGLAEAALCMMDAGYGEAEAVSMTIVEELQRRGAYHGRLKQLVDDGTIFQLGENGEKIIPAGADEATGSCSPSAATLPRRATKSRK